MARAARKPKDDDTGEVKAMDFAGAVRTYRQDIKPEISKAGEHNQAAGVGYKHIRKICNIPPAAAKFAFKMAETEEAKRDVTLRAINGLFKELGIFMPRDLMDIAEGKDVVESVVPTNERPRPNLVAIPDDDSDLADPSGKEPTEGTGAAAIAAMRAADAAEFDKVGENDLTH